MSFPWDGRYALILEDFDAPAGYVSCAGEPFGELRRLDAQTHFDSICYVPVTEYELIPAGYSDMTVLSMPDGREHVATVYLLGARTDYLPAI